MPHRPLTSARARRLLDRYHAGHLTKAAFCRKHSVTPALFTYWQPKLADAPRLDLLPRFRELQLPLQRQPSPCLLTLPSGARMEFPADQLSAALAVLMNGKAPC